MLAIQIHSLLKIKQNFAVVAKFQLGINRVPVILTVFLRRTLLALFDRKVLSFRLASLSYILPSS
jgi:hypothetical protein